MFFIIIELAVILFSMNICVETIPMVSIVVELTVIDFILGAFFNAIPMLLVLLPLTNIFLLQLFPMIRPESVIQSIFELPPVGAAFSINALGDPM